MIPTVDIIGAGLAGSEAALQLAQRGVSVRLFEMRPKKPTAVHTTGQCAELVCSNSLKSMKEDSAAGMLKFELAALGSELLACAHEHQVAAGGALAVERESFAASITHRIDTHPLITLVREEVLELSSEADAIIVASGPLTSDTLATSLQKLTGQENLAFFDAAAPIVMADSLDYEKIFKQSRYEEGIGDYLNAPFNKEEYEHFIAELIKAERVIRKDFETNDLFQACQPIEEIARKGIDAPRFGALKPVGLTDPRTGRRPWAALQLRAENKALTSFNLVGFQTNLTFSEQQRVFRLIPGLEKAEFARFGVMHRNTFIDAPEVLDQQFRLRDHATKTPLFFAGQITGTEGYCEAIMSGLHSALAVFAFLQGENLLPFPQTSASGALFHYATDPQTKNYQPMHVNFGLMPPLTPSVRNKRERYQAYAKRGREAFEKYVAMLQSKDLID